MSNKGRSGYVETECDRGNHNDNRILDYNPATVICMDCGKRRRLSELTYEEIEKVKKLECGLIKDFDALDYVDGPNGWPVLAR